MPSRTAASWTSGNEQRSCSQVCYSSLQNTKKRASSSGSAGGPHSCSSRRSSQTFPCWRRALQIEDMKTTPCPAAPTPQARCRKRRNTSRLAWKRPGRCVRAYFPTICRAAQPSCSWTRRRTHWTPARPSTRSAPAEAVWRRYTGTASQNLSWRESGRLTTCSHGSVKGSLMEACPCHAALPPSWPRSYRRRWRQAFCQDQN